MNEQNQEFVEETRVLADLLPYPKQREFFDDAEGPEFDNLVKDIKQRGLQQLPEILPENQAGLPPNTILLGHRRIRALIKLGYVEYEVVVRYDLAEASPETIEEEFLKDNLARRHQSRLSLARIYKRLLEIERAGRKPEFTRRGTEIHQRPLDVETRDLIGKQFGVSGRTLDRWCRVLELPLEIQQAVENDRLPITVGDRLASLKPSVQEKIAAAIRDGLAPRKAVAKYKPKARRIADANKIIDDLIKALKKGLKSVPKQLPVTTRQPGRDSLQVLTESKSLLDEVAAKLKDNKATWQAKMKAKAEDVDRR